MAAALIAWPVIARADLSLSGLVYSRANADLRQDNASEDNREWRNKFFLELKGEPTENSLAVLSALAEHTTLTGHQTRTEYQAGLYEAYIRLRKSDFSFHLGKQLVDWSKGDVSVIDTLNPRNLEEMLAREDEFGKLPVLMARVSYQPGDDLFEAVYVPFYTPSRLDLYGSDWALLNSKSLGSYQGEIDTATFTKQGMKPGIEDYPEANAVNGTAAARWDHRADGYDAQISYVNGWGLLPLFEFNPEFAKYLEAQPAGAKRTLETLSPQEVIAFSPLYKSRPVRQNQVGFGASTEWAESTFRGEASVVDPQELYTRSFKLTRHTVATATAGVDRFLPFNLYGNVTYVGAFVGGYPSEGLYVLQRWNHYGVVLLRGSYFDDKFLPELRVMAGLNRRDYMANPRLPFKVAESTQLIAGAYLINGSNSPGRESMFGQMRENRFAYLQLRYAF